MAQGADNLLLSVRLDDDLRDRLDQVGALLNLTRSEVVRRLIVNGLPESVSEGKVWVTRPHSLPLSMQLKFWSREIDALRYANAEAEVLVVEPVPLAVAADG